jgi:tRNA pseudouridine32 synthase/23S rRNA pseudouridine746 synthase
MNDPFRYTPHPLCLFAQERVAAFISNHPTLNALLAEGKMLGVLVCEDAQQRLGFLAAYSGRLQTTAELKPTPEEDAFFVPPIFDARQPGCHFIEGEARLEALNLQLERLLHSSSYAQHQQQAASVKEQARQSIMAYREVMRRSKEQRDLLRSQGHPKQPLIEESKWQNAEMHRLKLEWKAKTDEAEAPLKADEETLAQLRQQRIDESDALQRWLFAQYRLRNANGEARLLMDVAEEQAVKEGRHLTLPPAATGDCCAPKLLQRAYQLGLKPLQMGEFWWKPKTGDPQATAHADSTSPSETRHHLNFYPACHGRCRLVLPWMMEGLAQMPPHEAARSHEFSIPIVYDDPWLTVVVKPAGLLSVPNDTNDPSLVSIFNGCRHPEKTRHEVVYYPAHRLDQDTSGLLILAKSYEMLGRLQQMFQLRQVEKEYVALVELGEDDTDNWIQEGQEGWNTIDLPMRPDVDDRPRQVVDRVHGKQAVTLWRTDDATPAPSVAHIKAVRLALRPQTGRTHQLRVHCSHPEGLGHPIVGDRLYGHYPPNREAPTRLMLHACFLSFLHPVTGRRITLYSDPDF